MPVEDIPEEDLDVHLARPGRQLLPAPGGRLRPWIEWFGAGRLVAGAVTVIVLVAVGWWLLRSPVPPTEAGLPQATTAASVPATGTSPTMSTGPPTPIIVHVAGAVATPGVYELAASSRVEAALAAAGGPVQGADPGALNLAAPLVDGERVYVPVVGESPPPAPLASAATPAGPLDLNQATVDQLDQLPGIGPATATAIVEHRSDHGPFASVEDLEAVSGIGPSKLEALRDLVTV